MAVWLAGFPMMKALPFAPWLAWFWYCRPETRNRVVACIAACGLSLVMVWWVTTLIHRPRPLHPDLGIGQVAEVFGPHFAHRPEVFYWGCMPSDHAAYLAALSFGLGSIHRGLGLACFFWAIFVGGGLRMAIGLHYLSDYAVGVLVAMLAWVATSKWCGRSVRWLGSVRNPWLGAMVVVIVFEMAVFFQHLRPLEDLIFPMDADAGVQISERGS